MPGVSACAYLTSVNQALHTYACSCLNQSSLVHFAFMHCALANIWIYSEKVTKELTIC